MVEPADCNPDGWLAHDWTFAFHSVKWEVPFGAAVRIVRPTSTGYVVRLLDPIPEVPRDILIRQGSLLREPPDPQIVSLRAKFNAAFKNIWGHEYEPKLRPYQERVEKLFKDVHTSDTTEPPDRDRRERLSWELHEAAGELMRTRHAYFIAACQRAQDLSGWEGRV